MILWSVLAALVTFGLAACSGFLPPWSVVFSITAGMLLGPCLFAIGCKKLAICAGFAAVGFTMFLLRPCVDIRAPGPDEPIYDEYSFIEHTADTKYKNIAIASGTFTHGTGLSVRLCQIKAGTIQHLHDFTVGRTNNRIGAPHWQEMKFRFVLGERPAPNGRIRQLGCAGHSRGSGYGSSFVNNVQAGVSKTLIGRMRSGEHHIIYAEGQEDFDLDFNMPIEEFARRNNGEYLVVEAVLN